MNGNDFLKALNNALNYEHSPYSQSSLLGNDEGVFFLGLDEMWFFQLTSALKLQRL